MEQNKIKAHKNDLPEQSEITALKNEWTKFWLLYLSLSFCVCVCVNVFALCALERLLAKTQLNRLVIRT